MKRAAVIGVLTWLACSAGYWYWLHGRAFPPYDIIVPVVAGFVMAVLIGTLRIAAQAAMDAVRVLRASGRAGGEPPRDGETATVFGRIRTIGEPLRGPISGAPAVLYVYQIDHLDRYSQEKRPIRDYSGFGLAPAVIDSPYGPIRLLGFPDLESVDTVTRDSREAVAHARAYLASTSFIDMKAFSPAAMYREVKDVLTDADGCLRKDWRMTDDAGLSDKILSEQRVAPGEPVFVIGRYSAEQGGLVPDMAGRGTVLRLVPGEPEAAARALWRRAAWNLFAAVVIGGFVNGAIFGVLRAKGMTAGPAAPVSTSSTGSEASSLHDAVSRGDLVTAERLLRQGMPVDAREYDGSTALAHAPDEKTAAWLIARAADVNARDQDGQTVLIQQSTAGHADVVRLLTKAGAKLDAVSTKWKTTALIQALDAEQLEVAEILRAAGAHDETVTERTGHKVADDSAPARVCFAYLDAIQREDRAALSGLSTIPPTLDIDLGVWKGARPAHARVVSGFANDEAATLLLRGPNNDGRHTTWRYQLVRRDGEWKVSRENWETRLQGQP